MSNEVLIAVLPEDDQSVNLISSILNKENIKYEFVLPKNKEEWIRKIKGIRVLVAKNDPFPWTELINESDKLEMIQFFGAGYDQLDLNIATKKGICVCNSGEALAECVAQHALALILDLSKKVSLNDRTLRTGLWKRYSGFELWEKTLGVIGLGNIGSRLVIKARLAFNMRVIVYDPFVPPNREELFGVKMVDLKTLLVESDVISIHAPLTKETRQMIGEKELSLVKKSAIIINVARGEIIDENALINCLKNNLIAGAGLDVFREEPLQADSPLLKLDNVVLTPHVAPSSKEAQTKARSAIANNIIRFFKGQRPYWIQNLI